MELMIPLDSHSGMPYYEQIYEYIREEIKKGNLKSPTRLPSTRLLAEHLKVSRSTTQMAYEQLLSEGYIESVPCKGYFVSRIEELVDTGQENGGESPFFGMYPWEVPGDSQPAAAGEGEYRVDFSPRGVDLDSFPFNTWRKITKITLVDDNKEMFATGDPQGEPAFREAIRGYLHSARGVNCTAEQIVVGAGTEYLLMLLSRILGPDHTIAMENPTYKQAYRVFESLGYPVVPVEMDGSGLETSLLEGSGADIAYVMPSHQYPTGIVMPVKRRQELLSWACKKEGRYLIEDDYDSELRLGGKPFPTLQSIDVSDKVIYMNTFTKTLASTVRISYMVLPQTLAEKFYRELSFYSCTVSNFEQYTLAEFIENGSFEKHINRLRNYYQNKRDLILQALEKKPLGDYVTIEEEEAGVHFLMHLCTDQKEEKIVTQAKSRGVKLKPLSGYYADTAEAAKQENTYVMNYSSIDPAAMERAAGVLLHILQIPGR